MFHESEVSIQTWENVGRVSYSEMSVHPRSFWQQHHALIGIWSSESTCSASFLLCPCAVSHEDWGNRHQEPGKFTESIVAMAHFPWKKIVAGSCRDKSVAAVNAIKALAFINAGVMLWKRNAISQGGNLEGQQRCCCIQCHLDFAQTVLVGVEDVFWIDWIIFAWICWWKKACAKDWQRHLGHFRAFLHQKSPMVRCLDKKRVSECLGNVFQRQSKPLVSWAMSQIMVFQANACQKLFFSDTVDINNSCVKPYDACCLFDNAWGCASQQTMSKRCKYQRKVQKCCKTKAWGQKQKGPKGSWFLHILKSTRCSACMNRNIS